MMPQDGSSTGEDGIDADIKAIQEKIDRIAAKEKPPAKPKAKKPAASPVKAAEPPIIKIAVPQEKKPEAQPGTETLYVKKDDETKKDAEKFRKVVMGKSLATADREEAKPETEKFDMKKEAENFSKVVMGKAFAGDDKELQRVPLGIPEFDSMCNGGFPKGTMNIICGSAGSGKTIFCAHFLVNGIEKYDEAGLFVSFEEKKDKFYKNMLSVGIDLNKLEKDGKFVFLSYTPEQVKKILLEGGGLVENMIAENKIKRVVIDSLNAFTVLFKYEAEQREACLALFNTIDSWNCTALLTEEDKPSTTKRMSTVLDFEVDGVVFLYNLRKGDERQRAIEILKLRGTRHSTRICPFEITNSGVKIDASRRLSIAEIR